MSEYVNWSGFQVDPQNIPLDRPGAYRFTNLANGKRYIGIATNLARRCKGHARDAVRLPNQSRRRLPKFVNALRKYGPVSFLLEPVAYGIESVRSWTDDGTWLRELETELIVAEDTISSGYNILESWMGGPAGATFSQILKDCWADPELRAKMLAWRSDPEKQNNWLQKVQSLERRAAASAKTKRDFEGRARRELQSKAISRYFADNPDQAGRYFKEWWQSLTGEEKAQLLAARKPARLAIMRRRWADPEYRSRILAILRDPEVTARRAVLIAETWQDPNLRSEQSARLVEINARPGFRDRKSAWMREVNARPEVREKHRANTSSLVWVTDGSTNRRIRVGTPIPDGYRLGRVCPNGTNDGRKMRGLVRITDGQVNSWHDPTLPIPGGFHRGMRPFHRKE